MKNTLKLLIAISLVVMLIVPLVACSEEPAPTTNAPAATTPAATQPAATTAAPTTAAPKAVILRLSIPSPKGDTIVNNAEKFAAEFNAGAGGRYVIELHPGGSLIKMGESLDALRTGAVEMDLWPIGAFSSADPNFAAAELPFLVNSVEADAATSSEILPLYDKVMAKFNMKPVYTHTCLGIDLLSTKPVKTLADWKGLLCQSVSPQTAQLIQLLGGGSVPIDFSDAYQALQKKVIDATLQSASMMITFKLNEIAKYVLRGYLVPSSVVIAINMDVYNKMPADIQQLLMKCGEKASVDTNKFYVNVYQENYKTMADIGMTVYNLPKAERDNWAKLVQPYCDELYNKMDPDFAKSLKAIGTKLDQAYPYKE